MAATAFLTAMAARQQSLAYVCKWGVSSLSKELELRHALLQREMQSGHASIRREMQSENALLRQELEANRLRRLAESVERTARWQEPMHHNTRIQVIDLELPGDKKDCT